MGLLCCEQEPFALKQDHGSDTGLALGMDAVLVWIQIINVVQGLGAGRPWDDHRPWHGDHSPYETHLLMLKIHLQLAKFG